MKIIKPDYYDSFHCIAGDCSFTCCREWKIGVDDSTRKKWEKMNPPEGTAEVLRNAACYTKIKDGTRVMALNEQHVCPFLNPEGLCRMVITYGEQDISHTCHIFPREKHDFGDHLEYTLMPSCPEAVDCLNRAEFFKLQEERNKEPLHKPNTQGKLLKLRSMLMELFRSENETPEGCLQAAYFILQSCLQQGRIDEAGIRRDLPDLITALKDLDPDPNENFEECNELFLDLIENYRKEGMYAEELNEKAAYAERIADENPRAEDSEDGKPENENPGDEDPVNENSGNEDSVNENSGNENPGCTAPVEEQDTYRGGKFPKAWESFRPLLKKFLTQEIYADCLIPEGDLESMVIRLQWIAMEYTLIRHLSWLQFKKEGKLSYEDLRSYIVLASRMMGYEEEDIYEYMENSFEDLVWEWGYFMLITG